jgi:hypothetical protein
MAESHFTGTWTLTRPEGLKPLGDLTIVKTSSGCFTIAASGLGLDLPDLVYNAEQDMLIGRGSNGRLHGHDNTYDVAVVIYGTDPDFKCKGVVFPPSSSYREDNSVGTWTADKKGPTDPPPAC